MAAEAAGDRPALARAVIRVKRRRADDSHDALVLVGDVPSAKRPIRLNGLSLQSTASDPPAPPLHRFRRVLRGEVGARAGPLGCRGAPRRGMHAPAGRPSDAVARVAAWHERAKVLRFRLVDDRRNVVATPDDQGALTPAEHRVIDLERAVAPRKAAIIPFGPPLPSAADAAEDGGGDDEVFDVYVYDGDAGSDAGGAGTQGAAVVHIDDGDDLVGDHAEEDGRSGDERTEDSNAESYLGNDYPEDPEGSEESDGDVDDEGERMARRMGGEWAMDDDEDSCLSWEEGSLGERDEPAPINGLLLRDDDDDD